MTLRQTIARKNGVSHGLRALLHRALGLSPQELPIGGARRNSRRRDLELGLIGVDVAAESKHGIARGIVPLLAAGLVVALGVAALRIDMLRIRYALAETVAEEQRLLDEQRNLTVRMRTLRDPVHLASRARELGFVRPERLIDLPAVAPRAPGTSLDPGTALAASDTPAAARLARP